MPTRNWLPWSTPIDRFSDFRKLSLASNGGFHHQKKSWAVGTMRPHRFFLRLGWRTRVSTNSTRQKGWITSVSTNSINKIGWITSDSAHYTNKTRWITSVSAYFTSREGWNMGDSAHYTNKTEWNTSVSTNSTNKTEWITGVSAYFTSREGWNMSDLGVFSIFHIVRCLPEDSEQCHVERPDSTHNRKMERINNQEF